MVMDHELCWQAQHAMCGQGFSRTITAQLTQLPSEGRGFGWKCIKQLWAMDHVRSFRMRVLRWSTSWRDISHEASPLL